MEVRHAYRRLVKSAHPDLAGDTAQFRLVAHAYEVLSDPVHRAVYDRSLHPAPPVVPVPWRPRRRYGRYAALVVAALVAGGLGWLVVATVHRSVGDRCLVGTWRGEAFEIPFRGVLDGATVSVAIRGGAGVTLKVGADGTVLSDYGAAEALTGTDGAYRIEVALAGTTIERWHAADERVKQSGTDASSLSLRTTINGRTPEEPGALTVLDGEYGYTCTPTTLELGPYRYTRV